MKALYPGSFDPMTNGHLDIIERTSQLFDEVVIAIMDNPNKKNWFTPKERMEMMLPHLPHNVTIQIFPLQLTVDVAKKVEADVLIRGLRNSEDFLFEQNMAIINQEQTGIETLFLMSCPQYMAYSSSRIKELVYYHGQYQPYVKPNIYRALKEKEKQIYEDKK